MSSVTSNHNPNPAPRGQRLGYIRVSTPDQNTGRQLDGLDLDRTFTDRASGKDTNRPALSALLSYAREGDTVHVHSIDRLARSLIDLENLVSTMVGRGITVTFTSNGLTFSDGSSSPLDRLQFQLLGAFAEFERALMHERIMEGVEKAKAQGKYRGGRRRLLQDPAQIAGILDKAGNGQSWASLAREYKVSESTLYRRLREMGWGDGTVAERVREWRGECNPDP